MLVLLAKKNLVVVSLTSSCVITPLWDLSKTLNSINRTWQRQTASTPWVCSACSWPDKYQSCTWPDPAASTRHCCRRGRWVALVERDVLGDLVDFLSGEHAAVLDCVSSLKAVIHQSIQNIYYHSRNIDEDLGRARFEWPQVIGSAGKKCQFVIEWNVWRKSLLILEKEVVAIITNVAWRKFRQMHRVVIHSYAFLLN